MKPLVVRVSSAPNSEINVTPLVDVVLVLLIIFMVVTPLLEKDIKVALPNTEKVEDVKDVPPDQIIVRIAGSGDIEINNVATPLEGYVDRLKERLAARADKTVFVVADDEANYGRVVAVLDGAKAAGAAMLGMAAESTP